MPVTLVDNPLMRHKLGTLRNSEIASDTFRRTLAQMSVQMFYEATRDLDSHPQTINGAFGSTEVQRINRKIILVPLMRAGLGMSDPILELWPDASVGHIGIYRDKFLKNTVEYFFKLPKDVGQSRIYILDPIIATGDTAIASIDRLKEAGCKNICFLSLLASETGKNALMHFHSDVNLFTICTTDTLNEAGYLQPGIGDVCSRYYNSQ
ncbi:MAG: uracil phosphoribosyltransferase [Cellvibrionaceae bacterium]|nr:uracil phosphoribosyltransferase [Cellvibrionaceae bacterium]